MKTKRPRLGESEKLPETLSFGARTVRIGEEEVPLITQVRSYELLTPLFGGGREAGVPDADFPVNGKTVRGQLRFWWRAMCGHQFNDLSTLKNAEDSLWGCAASENKNGHSQVTIALVCRDSGDEVKPYGVKPNQRGRPVPDPKEHVAPSYASFPLQPEQKDLDKHGLKTPLKTLRANVKFDLEITFPWPNRMDLIATLWAWETFGGVGGRTRRGFGALRLTGIQVNSKAIDIAPFVAATPADVPAFIDKYLQRFLKQFPPGVSSVPHLRSRDFLVSKGGEIWSAPPLKVWSEIINSYRAFRQTKVDGKPQGRSEWPEADEIRFADEPNPKYPDNPFPRGVLGLPIIFHFQSQEGLADHTLLPLEHERLASPLLLKPVGCADGNAAGLVAALKLQWPDEGDDLPMRLTGPRLDKKVRGSLKSSKTADFPPLNGQTDVLRACIEAICKP